jgi:hypothetical protein
VDVSRPVVEAVNVLYDPPEEALVFAIVAGSV